MNGFYFDYQIFGCERLSEEEKRLRRSLQRGLSANRVLEELDGRRGLRRPSEAEEAKRPAFSR